MDCPLWPAAAVEGVLEPEWKKINVTINDNPEPVIIDMGLKLGAVLHIYGNPVTKKVWFLASVSLGKIALGRGIHRYTVFRILQRLGSERTYGSFGSWMRRYNGPNPCSRG
jgi:hypothetical protein